MLTPPPGRELLAGKRVVVTAAAGTGIGSAVAERCLLEGAQVLISDIHERRLGETAERLAEATGVRPHTAICNVTVEDDVQALVAAAVEASLEEAPVADAEFVHWKLAMERTYPIELAPLAELLGAAE